MNVLEHSCLDAIQLSLIVVVRKLDSNKAIVLLVSGVVNSHDEILVAIVINWAVGHSSVLLADTTFDSL